MIILVVIFLLSACKNIKSKEENNTTEINTTLEILEVDTTPPSKPILLTSLPSTTTKLNENITIKGEEKTTVWVNGQKVGKIGADKRIDIKLNTSGEDGVKYFSIFLKDENNNISNILHLSIIKTTAIDTNITRNTTTSNDNNSETPTVIADTIKPIITLLGDTPVNVIQGEEYNDSGATAIDNIDGNLTSVIVINNPVDTLTIGQYIITYNVIDSSQNIAIEVTRVVNVIPKPFNPIFSEFNVGIGGVSSFPFSSNSGEKIWVSAKNLLLNDDIGANSYYDDIKEYNVTSFKTLHNYVKESKFIILWLVEGWQESWYNLNDIQELMNAGYIPIFSYWYFGDKLLDGMPDDNKKELYAEDNLRVAQMLSKLNGEKMIIMEPEFNKPTVLESNTTQHQFASILSSAIDIIKKDNPELLFSLSMMDIGSRGVNDTSSKCGYENCSLGDKYAWERSSIVYEDLIDKLDFVSFHQMMGQFSRDYANPGTWDEPNIRAFSDDELGINFLAQRVSNMSKYLYTKYNKPVFVPYIAIATATWNDLDNDNEMDDNEINYYGWEDKANYFYAQLASNRETLKENGMFGFAPMSLFFYFCHDYGGYQYFMQNEYHLGIIGSSAIDEIDIAPYGDLYFKGNILDSIYVP